MLPTNPNADSEAKVAKSFHRCPVCQSIHYSKLEVRKHVRHDHKLVITKESFPELHYLRRDREPGPQNGGVQASSSQGAILPNDDDDDNERMMIMKG